MAGIYVVLAVIGIACGYEGSVQDTAFIQQSQARPWVVKEDDSGDELYTAESSAGVFSLFEEPETNTGIPFGCLGALFLMIYLYLASKMPGFWFHLLPLVFGLAMFGFIDVSNAIFGVASGGTTPIIQIDLSKRLIVSGDGVAIALCGQGIRVWNAGGRGDTNDVNLLEEGHVQRAAMFVTEPPAVAMMALIRRDADHAGCAIPDGVIWPQS